MQKCKIICITCKNNNRIQIIQAKESNSEAFSIATGTAGNSISEKYITSLWIAARWKNQVLNKTVK